MSITSGKPAAVRADSTAPRSLFTRLIDDAAVFPPGLAPLPRAVSDHLWRAGQPNADLVGPLLVAASSAQELRRLKRTGPLRVVLIARVDTPLTVVSGALAELGGSPDMTEQDGLEVAAVEIGWSGQWAQSLTWGLSLPVTVEVPRDAPGLAAALADLREQREHSQVRVQAKLRTGSTPAQPVPTGAEVTHFIASCVQTGLPFKLTGGLHHVLAHTTAEGEDQHGLLNVLVATHQAIAGTDLPALEGILAQRDPRPLVETLAGLSEEQARAVRGLFTAYGCCGVLDPIGELRDLGLIAAL